MDQAGADLKGKGKEEEEEISEDRADGLVWDSANGRQNCWNQFFRQYMGLEYSVSAGEQSERILSGQEYAEMSVFPADGSVKIIEGCVVVKLSD